MKKRIFSAIFCACLGVLAVGLLLASVILSGYDDLRTAQELETRAAYLQKGVAEQKISYLQQLPYTEDRITLIDAEGTVLYDNRAEASEMENHGDREEVREALQQGEGHAQRTSETISEKTTYYALRLENGQVLRLGVSRSTVWTLLAHLLPALAVALIELAALTGLLASRVSQSIVQPINALQLDHPEVQDTYEELSPLLRRINAQNRRIAAQMEELGHKQKEFSVVAENMKEGLLLMDAEARVLFCNHCMARFLQVAEEAPGQNILTLNRSEAFRTVAQEVLKGNRATGLLSLNGRKYELIANPVFGGSGEEETAAQQELFPPDFTGAVLLMVDVTEREEREQLRREFTASVSHELKTPLTSIYGSSELLAGGVVRPQDVPAFAADIHQQAERMIHLIEDILRLSQLDEGELALSKEPVDLYVLARQVCEELTAQAKKQQITFLLQGESCTVQGVPALLHELLGNLCDNAIKYNKPGGKVWVRVQLQPQGGCVLSVQDTGIGIAPEQQSRVFERFYRVDKSHSRLIGGTGLGLSIVKHAAQLHGAQLTLESTLGQGTTISVKFM